MKKLNLIALAWLFIFGQSAFANSAELAPELQVFAPYLGTWEAEFDTPPGKPKMTDVSTSERHLNGKAIRTTHSINDGVYGGESIIFFDKEKQKLVFYYFTTADFFTNGTIDVLEDGSFVAYEDVIGNENGITKVKSTSKMVAGKMQISTSYLKNGKWTEPEYRTYSRSDKAVVFK